MGITETCSRDGPTAGGHPDAATLGFQDGAVTKAGRMRTTRGSGGGGETSPVSVLLPGPPSGVKTSRWGLAPDDICVCLLPLTVQPPI